MAQSNEDKLKRQNEHYQQLVHYLGHTVRSLAEQSTKTMTRLALENLLDKIITVRNRVDEIKNDDGT